MPAETTALIRRWANDRGQDALIEATLVQVDQPETLTDLLADSDVRPFLQTVPGTPTLALICSDAVEHIRAFLKERGMTLVDHLIS